MNPRGKAWKFGNNVNTDEIIPATFLSATKSEELGRHCMGGIDPEFANKVSPGDVIVSGKNFGCGSSREHAPRAIKGCGVSCVVAKSFARIFYRNAINVGLPIIESPSAVDGIREGDLIEVDLSAGRIRNTTTGERFQAEPFPPFMQELMRWGGMMGYVKATKMKV